MEGISFWGRSHSGWDLKRPGHQKRVNLSGVATQRSGLGR